MQGYTPTAARTFQSLSPETINSGARAQARHGIAFDNVSLNSSLPRGLHPMDMALRQGEGPLIRDTFLRATEGDLHDAVHYYVTIVVNFTYYSFLRRQLLTMSQAVLQ